MKKEANLISSPVLREFYNEALKNKWITEGELTKSASVSIDKYAATGNYTQDLVNLASGLRELGLYEQAESLEVKLNIFKKAQLAFSNLIDEQSRALQQAAHAESAKVVDAQGGWGVVHTNMDRQRKILETLTHQPGVSSQAPVMQNLVTAAAEILGLLKFAKESGSPATPTPAATVAGAGAGSSRTTVDIKEIPLTTNQKDKAKQVLAIYSDKAIAPAVKVKSLLQAGMSKFKIYASSLNKEFFLKNGAQEPQLKDFSILANVDYAKASEYLNAALDMSPDGLSSESIENIIRSGNYTSTRTLMSSVKQKGLISAGTFSTYFDGTNIKDLSTGAWWEASSDQEKEALNNMWKSGATEYRHNPSSIWEGDIGLSEFTTDKTKRKISFDSGPYIRDDQVSAAAQAVYKEILSKLDSYFGNSQMEEKDNTILKIEGFVNSIIGALDNILSLAGQDKSSNLIYIKTLTDSTAKIDSTLAAANADANLWSIMYNKLGDQGLMSTGLYDLSAKSIPSTIEEIKRIPITARDVESPETEEGDFKSIVDNLIFAYNKYSGAAQGSFTDDVKNKAQEIAGNLDDLIKKVQLMKNYGTSDVAVEDVLGTAGFKTFEDLVTYAQSAATTAAADFPEKKENFLKNNLIKKLAAPPFAGLGGGGAGKPPGGPAKPGVGGGYQPAVLGPTKTAIQNMQWALNKLSDYLMTLNKDQGKKDAAVIRTVGKTGPAATALDGVWKDNTKNSLERAKKYVTSISKLGPKFETDEEKRAAAEENYNKIYKFLQLKNFSLSGAPISMQIIVFDKIPNSVQGFTINQNELTAPGEIEVTRSDLQTLKSFYNFVKENLQLVGVESRATAADFWDLLNWFSARSALKIQKPEKIEYRTLYQNYFKHVEALKKDFLIIVKNLNLSPNNPEEWNSTPLGDIFSSGGAGGVSGGAGVGGLGSPDGGRRGPGTGRGEGGGGEGGSLEEGAAGRQTSKPPFDKDNIYFESRFFIDSPDGIDTLSSFDLMGDPVTVATKYFDDKQWSSQDMQKYYSTALARTGFATSNDQGDWFYKNPTTGQFESILNLPTYRSRLPILENLGQLTAYYQLLESLPTKLKNSYNSYTYALERSGKSDSQQYRAKQDLSYYQTEWLNLIRRQQDKIRAYVQKI